MSRRTLIIAVLAAALTMAFAATAFAGTVNGRLVSFTYNSAKTGKVVVKTGSGKKTFVVSPKTNCGYSKGQSGGPLPCASLKKAKYVGKKLFVRYAIKNGKKVATLVSVAL